MCILRRDNMHRQIHFLHLVLRVSVGNRLSLHVLFAIAAALTERHDVIDKVTGTPVGESRSLS